MNLNEIISFKKEISLVAKAVLRNGWGEATSGNFSWNITEVIKPNSLKALTQSETLPAADSFPKIGGQVLLISTSGSRMRTLAEGSEDGYCLLRISEDGNRYQCFGSDPISAKAKPSSETPAHLEIHNHLKAAGKPYKAVLHTHMTEAVIATHHPEFKSEEKLNAVLKAMQPEMTTFLPSGVGVIPYELPGSQKIGKATAKKFGDFDVVLWEKHGCFAVGRTLHEALDKQEMVAKSLQVFFSCLQSGYHPEGLTEKQLLELRKFSVG
ncbi:MAG: rhamnulose-1-phosphate aldolase [Bacteroidota bacterium]